MALQYADYQLIINLFPAGPGLRVGPADGPVRAVGGGRGPCAAIVRSSYKSGLCGETSEER